MKQIIRVEYDNNINKIYFTYDDQTCNTRLYDVIYDDKIDSLIYINHRRDSYTVCTGYANIMNYIDQRTVGDAIMLMFEKLLFDSLG